MITVNLKGYVSRVRASNTLASGKMVGNVVINVPVGKDRDGKNTYQNFDVAFWNESATKVDSLNEKDYVILPDVMLTEFSTSESNGKTYINIRGMGRDVFVAPAREEGANNKTSNSTAPKNDDVDNEPF